MSGPNLESPRWGRRRWVGVVVALLLVHAALVFWFGERSQPVGVVAKPEPWLKLVVDPPSSRPSALSPQASDPTLFALPSHQGFSGAAWLDLLSASSAPPAWAEPPGWLPAQTNELGAGFLRFVRTNTHPDTIARPAWDTSAGTADILLVNDAVTTQSVVQIQGPLTNRQLLAPLTVPNPVHPDTLLDTVIQVRVNRDGLNESAILVQGCGLKSADDAAITAARAARFLPVASAVHQASGRPAGLPGWGRMVFQWFTISPPTTNVTALN
jgi:hypothetical protein